MTDEELVDWLAEKLRERMAERRRESMPSLEVPARDGTVLLVTLKEHHREGCVV